MCQNGQKAFPLAAYPRGLYYHLTGEIMYRDIPIYEYTVAFGSYFRIQNCFSFCADVKKNIYSILPL
jgi:hypothetical protein